MSSRYKEKFTQPACESFDQYFEFNKPFHPGSSGDLDSALEQLKELPDGSILELGGSRDYGNHAIVLTGIDHEKQYFEFKNSWGADSEVDDGWGDGGYGYLSYEYFKKYALRELLIYSNTDSDTFRFASNGDSFSLQKDAGPSSYLQVDPKRRILKLAEGWNGAWESFQIELHGGRSTGKVPEQSSFTGYLRSSTGLYVTATGDPRNRTVQVTDRRDENALFHFKYDHSKRRLKIVNRHGLWIKQDWYQGIIFYSHGQN